MRIGYVVPNSWGIEDPDEVLALAVRAEHLGADSLWVSHHVLHQGFVGERLAGGRPYLDPLALLAVLATTTSSARLGTSVLVLPYLHPMPTAKLLATIDHLSRGRLDVGVGVGGLRVEHDAIGQVPFEQRGTYADEFLEVLGLLWTGRPASFDGEHFTFDQVEAHPGPFHAGGLPLLVGGVTPAALRRAARFGAGWHGIGLDPDQVPDHIDALHDALRAQDRPVEGFAVQVRLHLDVADVEQWGERVRAYARAGVTELVLAPQSDDRDEHLRWMAQVLVPALDASRA